MSLAVAIICPYLDAEAMPVTPLDFAVELLALVLVFPLEPLNF
tara:strand:+ start:1738 stop:1866 length:129 start_codon:yes stop_codon:yes gene_type:complete